MFDLGMDPWGEDGAFEKPCFVLTHRKREALFANMASADLALVEHRTLDGRVLLVEYRPTGKDIPRA
jgi:hypothetical protein